MADQPCPNATHITPPGGGQCPCGAVTSVRAVGPGSIRIGPTVAGNCPMGGGDTLYLAAGGHVTCSWALCPRPEAVTELLADAETDHLVDLAGHSGIFTVRHPLRERLDDQLMTCQVPARVAAGSLPPQARGRYRLVEDGGDGFLWWAVQ